MVSFLITVVIVCCFAAPFLGSYVIARLFYRRCCGPARGHRFHLDADQFVPVRNDLLDQTGPSSIDRHSALIGFRRR